MCMLGLGTPNVAMCWALSPTCMLCGDNASIYTTDKVRGRGGGGGGYSTDKNIFLGYVTMTTNILQCNSSILFRQHFELTLTAPIYHVVYWHYKSYSYMQRHLYSVRYTDQNINMGRIPRKFLSKHRQSVNNKRELKVTQPAA